MVPAAPDGALDPFLHDRRKCAPQPRGRCMLASVGSISISLKCRRLPILHKCILEVPPCYPYEEAVICLTFRLMRLFAIQPRQVSKVDLSGPLAGQSCNHVGQVFGNTFGTA